MKKIYKSFLSVCLMLFSCISFAQTSDVKVFDSGVEPVEIIYLSVDLNDHTPKLSQPRTSEVAFNKLEFSETDELQSRQLIINYIDKSNSYQIRNDAKVQNQNFEVRNI